MEVKLLAQTPNPIDVCRRAAGICVGKPGSIAGLMAAIESGHESVIEHVSFTFEVSGVSRALLAQLTRHRLASFSVESQRYCTYDDGLEFVMPDGLDEYSERVMRDALDHALEAYLELLRRGVPEEDARYVLPNACPTKIVFTMNARELRHFLRLRCCKKAQWEIRNLAHAVLAILSMSEAAPLFRGAGAPCKSGECTEKHPCWESACARH